MFINQLIMTRINSCRKSNNIRINSSYFLNELDYS